MKSRILNLIIGTFGGLALGVLFSIRWALNMLDLGARRPTGLTWLVNGAFSTNTLVFLCAILVLLSAIRFLAMRYQFISVFALFYAAVMYALLLFLKNACHAAQFQYAYYFFATCLIFMPIFFRRNSGAIFIAMIAAALSFIPQSLCLPVLLGDNFSFSVYTYGPLPSINVYLSAFASAALFSLLAILFYPTSPRVHRSFYSLVMLPFIIGTAGVAIILAHTTAACVSMSTSHDIISTARVLILFYTSIAFLLALSIAFSSTIHSTLLRFLPSLPIFVCIIYISLLNYGYSDFRALSMLHYDSTYAYIHCKLDSSFTRTVDTGASLSREFHAQQFVSRYPFSAYRPAALRKLAEAQLALWRLNEAKTTFRQICSEYPSADDYIHVLYGIAALAANEPQPLFQMSSESKAYNMWLNGQGAGLAATATRRLHLFNRSQGYYSAAISYLSCMPPSRWKTSAISILEQKSDELLTDKLSHHRQQGTVIASISANNVPVRDAIIALVQPRRDPAVPIDSRQFTGPWSLVPWNGYWARTDGEGTARIKNVPFDSYDIVIGLPLRSDIRRLVLSAPPSGVRVTSSRVIVPPIRLNPAIVQIFPSTERTYSVPPILRWKAYPNAHHYSVSIIDMGPSNNNMQFTASGTTCWSRTHIIGTHAILSAANPVTCNLHFSPKHRYSWVVYAYSGNSRLISSSEHYFDLREPGFLFEP